MGESFLKDAIDRIVGLAAPKTYEIGPHTYANQELKLVDTEPSRPLLYSVDTLSGLVKIVKEEGVGVGGKLFVQVEGHRHVNVWTHYLGVIDREFERWRPYEAMADVPCNTVGRYMDQQQAIIELQSLYNHTPDRDYLLDLLSKIDVNQGVISTDNGVTQEATVKTGVVLKDTVVIKPIVELQPFRTFLEVDQPVSRFLLRINDDGKVGLFEADGGAWKLEAKRSIATWLSKALTEEIDAGKVVVMI